MFNTSEKEVKGKTTTKDVNLNIQGKRSPGRPRSLQEMEYDQEELERRKAWEDGDEWRHIWNRPSERTR